MKISKSILPKSSILNSADKKYDFVDSFMGDLHDGENKLTSVDIGKAFFRSGPQWVGRLFYLRNKVVAIFGLKTAGAMSSREEQLQNFRCEAGEQVGLFKVYSRTANEVVLGEDDKHLNFRVSLYLAPANGTSASRSLTISTTVEFINWTGRLYFLPVRPFHKLIVPTMLRGIINELDQR